MYAFRTYWSIGLLALLMVFTGCTNNGNQADADSSPQAQESAAPGGSTASQARKVTDELGHELTIPAAPKRIIGIYLEDELTALGVKPLRQSRIGDWSGQSYLNLGLPDIDIQGSVEAFVEAQPDLMLINVYNDKTYDTLSKVAPFYAFKDARADWRATIKTLGELLGKTEQAEKVITDYNKMAADAKEKLHAAVGNETVAILRVHTNSIRLYGGPGYAGPVLYKELGLQPAQAVKDLVLDKNLGVASISMEIIPQLNADHIFLTMDTGADQQFKNLTESAIWKDLPAVRNGKIHQVNFETWMKSGPIADEMKIKDVVKALVK